MKCPYCETTNKNSAGLSMHVKKVHPDKWKGTLKSSVPSDYVIVEPPYKPNELRVFAHKGEKKKPIPSECKWCDYKTNHRPALATHIKGTHPLKWKGNLGSSLGLAPSRPWKQTDKVKSKYPSESKEAKQKRQREWYMAKRAAQGKPYTPRTHKRIEPIVYRRSPSVMDAIHADLQSGSLREDILERVAQKIADKMLE